MNSPSPFWLAIETSSPWVSLAAGRGSQCLQSVSREGNASEWIEPLFRELRVDPQEVELYVIGQGPGSYNGLRVGYGFLKGFLCLDPRPVVQIPTPLTLAAQALEASAVNEGRFLILNNARRDEIYGALVEAVDGMPKLQWETVSSEKTLRSRLPSDITAVVSYDYASADLPHLAHHRWLRLLPSAEVTGRLAHQLRPPTVSLVQLEPHYVRSAVPVPARPSTSA